MKYLVDNVYFVEGNCNAAFYDLNTNNLYQVSQDGKNLIRKALSGNTPFSVEETNFLNKLEQKKLITSAYVSQHKILDLAIKSKIDFAWIEITNSCNLKCIHCYDEASFGYVKILPYDSFCHIVDELLKNQIKRLQIIGGEPFILGNHLFKYLDYVKGKFDYLEIFTNGTLVKKEWLPYFKANHIRLALSVYSYNPLEHAKVTQSSISWNLTNKTIQNLHDAGIPYRVCNVLMKNVDLGEKSTNLYHLRKNGDVVRLTGRANKKLLSKELLRKRLITKKTFTKKLSKKFIRRIISGNNCFASKIYISVDQEVYPCVMERRISHGNLTNTSLKNLLKKNLRMLTKDHIDGCKSCEFRYTCFDCRPNSNGAKLLAKPWYCTYEPITGRWIDENIFIDKFFAKKM